MTPAELDRLLAAERELDVAIAATRELIATIDDRHAVPTLLAREYAAEGLDVASGVAAMAVLRLAGSRRPAPSLGVEPVAVALTAVLIGLMVAVLGGPHVVALWVASGLGAVAAGLWLWLVAGLLLRRARRDVSDDLTGLMDAVAESRAER